MTHKEKALSYFSNNFNCSQSVFTTFATEMGFDEETALMISTNFGGGARCGELCGAVAGAHMVLGLKHGHCHSDNADEKARAMGFGAGMGLPNIKRVSDEFHIESSSSGTTLDLLFKESK